LIRLQTFRLALTSVCPVKLCLDIILILPFYSPNVWIELKRFQLKFETFPKLVKKQAFRYVVSPGLNVTGRRYVSCSISVPSIFLNSSWIVMRAISSTGWRMVDSTG